jgi:hypothetical protein
VLDWVQNLNNAKFGAAYASIQTDNFQRIVQNNVALLQEGQASEEEDTFVAAVVRDKWSKALGQFAGVFSCMLVALTTQYQGMASKNFQYMPTSLSVKFPICL